MPQHCSKKHRFPWGEGKGAIFSLDEVFWYLSPSAEMYPNGDMSLAGSSDHARAHEHRSALQQESGPFPGFPAGCGSQVPDFLVSPPRADCRYTCHQECRSLIQLDCRRPGQCQSQLSPESTLLPPCTQVRRGGGSAGGVDSLMVTDRISFRDLISCSRRVLQEEGLGREVSPSVLQTQAGLANELPM